MRHSMPLLAATALMALLLSGCGVAPQASSTAAKDSAPAATEVPVKLLGPQLAKLLLPKSAMPAGYSLSTIQGAVQDSGKVTPHDTPEPPPAGQLCQAFAYSDFIAEGGIADSTYAQTAFSNPGDTAEVDQFTDEFTGSDAQTVMSSLWSAAGTCTFFSYNDNGTTVDDTLTRYKLAGTGDQAIEVISRSPQITGQTTMIAVRVANVVISVASSAAGPGNAAGAISYARQVAARLRAAAGE
jgi:hypothetical protein